MTGPPQVLVVGSVNVDLVMAVDHLPAPGETVAGGRFAQGHGGKGGNQAVAAARAGADVRIAGAVGDDAYGHAARAALEADGVDTRALATTRGVPTGVALVVVDAAGANQISVALGANEHVDPAGARTAAAALDPARATVLLSFELADAPLLAAAEVAAAAGIPVVVNPAPARPPAPELVALRPILTPNASEAEALGGADALAARTGAPVVVTRGAAGALVVAPGSAPLTVAAPPVAVVDTTGAGDVLSGVLAAGLAARMPLADAVAAAVAAASASVSRAGAR